MINWENIQDKIPARFRNKYILTAAVFLIWVALFDGNNLVDRFRDMRTLHQLEKDREYYSGRIEEERRKLNELRTSDENLEKFAREQYYMKEPGEEIFVIITPEKEKEVKRRRNRKW